MGRHLISGRAGSPETWMLVKVIGAWPVILLQVRYEIPKWGSYFKVVLEGWSWAYAGIFDAPQARSHEFSRVSGQAG